MIVWQNKVERGKRTTPEALLQRNTLLKQKAPLLLRSCIQVFPTQVPSKYIYIYADFLPKIIPFTHQNHVHIHGMLVDRLAVLY